MEDETSNTNLEWKKKGFGDTEKLTLKTNIKKALIQEATDKKPVQTTFSSLPSELPKGLKKIRKKIKDSFDEDDENDFITAPLEINNSLLNALHDDEKRQLHQQDVLNNQRMQQNAGKMEAILMANQLNKTLGLKGLKQSTINQNMQDVTQSGQTYEKTIKDDLSSRLKIKGRRLSERDTITLLRGIKRIQNMAVAADESKVKALENLKIEEIVNAGQKNTDDEQVANLILTKSGRKNKNDGKKVAAKTPKQNSKTTELYQEKKLYR